MRGASTLLPHVSEISFPIQKRIEFGRLGELDLVGPADALGVFIDELGLAYQRLVYAKDFAANGRIEVACGLDRLDNADRAALLHLLADVRELNISLEPRWAGGVQGIVTVNIDPCLIEIDTCAAFQIGHFRTF